MFPCKQHINGWIRSFGTWAFWIDFVVMTVGMLISAIAVYYFLMPSRIIVGTIAGLCMVINEFVGGTTTTFSCWMIGTNLLLLALAFLLVGGEFGVKTIYSALIFGPLTDMLDHVLPYTTFTHRVIDSPDVYAQLQAGCEVLDAHGNPYLLSRSGEVLQQVRDSVMSAGLGMGDVWFDVICFVFLLGLSQAIMFHCGASTGGLDIVAKILNKFVHLDIGAAVSVSGALVCLTAFFIHDFRMVLIGLIITWIDGLAVNYFTASLNNRKRVCIISQDYECIRHFIIHDLVRGCSLYKVEGGYSGEIQTEIQTLLTQEEFGRLMNFMQSNHIHAFTTAGNCSEVYGLWANHRKWKNQIEQSGE